MKPVEPLFQTAAEAHEVPPQEWRCGRCSSWRNEPILHNPELGRCIKKEAMTRVFKIDNGGLFFSDITTEDFGCRFFTAKPLEDEGAHG
jgi:hypothetical protein